MSKEIPMCPCCSIRHVGARPHCQWCINHPNANPRAGSNSSSNPPKGRKRTRIW